MADLIAQGTEPTDRWRRPLSENESVVVGRAAQWPTPWDDRISREHVKLHWDGTQLNVERLPAARNPVFHDGQETDAFSLLPGGHFVIGGTTFALTTDRALVTLLAPQPAQRQSFSAQYLRRMRFRHADQRIETLSRLPEVISAANSELDQRVCVVNLLLSGIPQADAVALVAIASEAIELLQWDRRRMLSGNFEPSDRLIRDAIARQESVTHVWKEHDANGGAFTARQGVDWAFCMPIPGKASEGWGIYASGQFSSEPGSERSDPTDLRDDLKFAELTASFYGSLREQRRLERERASLSPFFSPVVLETLGTADPDVVLQPREAEVTVLFCDLRGFSRASEKAANDLLALLGRVSSALGIATRQIVEQSGVLGDFHGDAVMGFWGWPLAQADAAARAARAALAIRAEFQAASQTEDSLSQFRVGIGIGTGRAVAGKIGTINQVKVTAFGPVVNLASRLENITKTLQAPILLDERTAQLVREQLPANVARLRRVARIRPYGLDVPLEVTELLPPESEFPQLTSGHITKYELALDDFCAGHWQAAFEHLHQVPADDRVKDFLTMFIVQHGRTAPEGWNGVISLPSK